MKNGKRIIKTNQTNMKKTSNKILAALIILMAVFGIAFIIFVKANGKGEIKNTTDVIISNELVQVKLSYHTTEEDLNEISKRLLNEKNISFDFSDSEFNDDGQLEKLDLEVNCNDGFEGSLKAGEFELKMSQYGFERDYTENAEEPFTIGEIELLVNEFIISNQH